jgi:hypothetical protein
MIEWDDSRLRQAAEELGECAGESRFALALCQDLYAREQRRQADRSEAASSEPSLIRLRGRTASSRIWRLLLRGRADFRIFEYWHDVYRRCILRGSSHARVLKIPCSVIDGNDRQRRFTQSPLHEFISALESGWGVFVVR